VRELLVSVTAITALALVATTQNANIQGGRRLGEGYHNLPPPERNTNPAQTYDYDNSKYKLMEHTPCRPENDGYFGSTSGEKPLDLQYGFEMESNYGDEMNGDSRIKDDELLQAMQEHIIEQVLIKFFPDLCGYRRRATKTSSAENTETIEMHPISTNEGWRGLQGEKINEENDFYSDSAIKPVVRGFHFGLDLPNVKDKCEPATSPDNNCSVHSNTISLFGKNLSDAADEVLLQVIQTLVGMEHRFAKDGLVRLTIREDVTREVGEYDKPEYDEEMMEAVQGLSPGVKTAIALASIALATCLAAILLYITVDRRASRRGEHFAMTMEVQDTGEKGSSSFTGLMTKQKRKRNKKDISCGGSVFSARTHPSLDEDSSNISDVVGLRCGSNVVLGDGGRPIVIEFPQHDSDSLGNIISRNGGCLLDENSQQQLERRSGSVGNSKSGSHYQSHRSQSTKEAKKLLQNTNARAVNVEDLSIMSTSGSIAGDSVNHFSKASNTWETGSRDQHPDLNPLTAPSVTSAISLIDPPQTMTTAVALQKMPVQTDIETKKRVASKKKPPKQPRKQLPKGENSKKPHTNNQQKPPQKLPPRKPTPEISTHSSQEAMWSDCSYIEVSTQGTYSNNPQPPINQSKPPRKTNNNQIVLATVEPGNRVTLVGDKRAYIADNYSSDDDGCHSQTPSDEGDEPPAHLQVRSAINKFNQHRRNDNRAPPRK